MARTDTRKKCRHKDLASDAKFAEAVSPDIWNTVFDGACGVVKPKGVCGRSSGR